MARIRTFIAVELDKDVRDRIVSLRDRLATSSSSVKWVESDNLHITMFFLGEVDEREIPSVCGVVNQGVSDWSRFELTMERVGSFPNNYRPRIIWVGVGQGAEELVEIHRKIEPALLNLGCYRREERMFKPHVTLGRIRSERRLEGLTVELSKQSGWHTGPSLVQELVVMSSELTPQGPLYSVLGRARLR